MSGVIRVSEVIMCHLDRALANEDWHEIFSHSYVEYLGIICSDHLPILATIETKYPTIGNNSGLIRDGWDVMVLWRAYPRDGMQLQMVWELMLLAKSVNVSWKYLGGRKINLYLGGNKFQNLQKVLEEMQNDDNRTHDELVEITRKLKKTYKDEETFWRQKSRVAWLKEGDHNTKFFHAKTKQRRAENRIIGLWNEYDDWIMEDKEIVRVASNYFKELFSSSNPNSVDEVWRDIPSKITMRMNETLTAKATEEEVHMALFKMHPKKAPGPDGMTTLFC